MFVAGALALVSGARSGAEPLQPLKPWVLDYAEAQCVASRDYATPDHQITLAIRPIPNGTEYEIFAIRSAPGPMFAEELTGSVDFGRGPIKAWLLHYRIDAKRREAFQFRIGRLEMMEARGASAVTLNIKDRVPIIFSLEAMPDLLDVLDACTADLKRYWNMDGTQVATVAVPPKGDVRSVFSSEDYPDEALTRGQEGSAQFLLLIDETGRVAACNVTLPSGVPALDAMGCIAIQSRAKFRPARDHSGKTTKSTFITPPVVWRLM